MQSFDYLISARDSNSQGAGFCWRNKCCSSHLFSLHLHGGSPNESGGRRREKEGVRRRRQQEQEMKEMPQSPFSRAQLVDQIILSLSELIVS